MKAYEPAALDGAPDGFLTKNFRSRELDGHQLTIQVAPDDCTGCGICVDVCPAKDKTQVKRKAINMRPASEHRVVERERWDFFDVDPRTRPSVDHPRLGEELPAAAAAVRVLRCLLGMRRDAVPEAADAAVRRPARRCQRHRVLVDLRRQPADHPVVEGRQRARPGLVELAVRGQRRVRLRHAPRHRTPPARGPAPRRGTRRRRRHRPGEPRCSPTRRRPRPAWSNSAPAWRCCASASAT